MTADTPSPPTPHALSIQLLGGFHIAVGSRPIPKRAWRARPARGLVKLLALAPRHHLYREQLTDLLWPEQDPRTSAGRLKQALHRARHALEPALPPYGASAYLRRQGDLVLLTAPGPLHIDVEAFQAAARAARRTQEPARYEAALALYRGALLPEDRFADWARGPREQLHALQCALLVELAALREHRGELDAALEALRQVVASDPAHEQAHVRLMRLLARAG